MGTNVVLYKIFLSKLHKSNFCLNENTFAIPIVNVMASIEINSKADCPVHKIQLPQILTSLAVQDLLSIFFKHQSFCFYHKLS